MVLIEIIFFPNRAHGCKLSYFFIQYFKLRFILYRNNVYYSFNRRQVVDHIFLYIYFMHASNFRPNHTIDMAYMVSLWFG